MPILVILFDYIIKTAIPLSKVCSLGGAVGNMLMIVNNRHPTDQNRLIIDFKFVALISPLLLVGTTTGIILLKVLPSLVIIICMSAYVLYSTVKLYWKAKETYAAESEELKD